MTPPDSGERCKWIVNGERSGRCVLRSDHAGAHEPDDPRDSGEREVQGPWPRICVQRAFVDGMRWWQFHKNGSTAFASECDEAEAEAVRKYGEPSARAMVPLPLAQRILAALGEHCEHDLASELRAAVERNSGKECGHLLSSDLGAEWRCGKPKGHEGPHSGTKP